MMMIMTKRFIYIKYIKKYRRHFDHHHHLFANDTKLSTLES